MVALTQMLKLDYILLFLVVDHLLSWLKQRQMQSMYFALIQVRHMSKDTK